MSERLVGALDKVAHKWRRLAERRRAHFVELFHSGRWKHYFTEEQFLQSMREAIRVTERWALIAPPSAEVAKDRPAEDALPAAAPLPEGGPRPTARPSRIIMAQAV